MMSVYDVTILLLHYAMMPEFQKLASTKLQEKHWDPIRECALLALWRAIHATVKTGCFRQTTMHIRAALSHQPDGMAIESSRAEFFKQFYAWIDTFSPDCLNLAYAKELLQKFMNERHALQLLKKFVGTDNIDGFAQEWEQTARETKISTNEAIRPLMPGQPKLSANFERIPLGISWFDDLIGGGAGKCDSILFLAPSGGGKTVFGMQAAIKRCMLHKYVDVFLYEQPPSGDIAVRLYSLVSKAHRKDIEGRDYDELPADIRAKIDEWSNQYGKFLRLHDFSSSTQGCNGVIDLKAELEKHRDAGEPSSLIIIDWVSSACRKFLAAKPSRSKDDIYTEIVNFSREYRELLVDLQCQGIMLQQIAPALVKTVGGVVHYSDAMDCKSIGLFSAWCVGIGRLEEPSKIGTLWLSKARQGENGSISLKLNGGYCKFELSGKKLDQGSHVYLDEPSQ